MVVKKHQSWSNFIDLAAIFSVFFPSKYKAIPKKLQKLEICQSLTARFSNLKAGPIRMYRADGEGRKDCEAREGKSRFLKFLGYIGTHGLLSLYFEKKNPRKSSRFLYKFEPRLALKKTFVLLEIIIAFALVSIATLPFFRYPFQHMQKELSTLFEMELEQIAQNKIINLHEQLLSTKIAQGLIFGDQKQKSPMEINFVTVQLAPSLKRIYEEKVFVTWEKQKLSNDQKITVLVHFKVQYRKPNKKMIILEAGADAIAHKKLYDKSMLAQNTSLAIKSLP